MTASRIHMGFKTAAATLPVVVSLCLAPVSVQAGNPWNPYPAQQAQPAPAPPPAPKPKYYTEAPVTPPATQAAPTGPSQFAPPDLDRQLSAGPQRPPRPPYAPPFGYQGAPVPPYAAPPAYSGAPPNYGGYGGYGPPMGNTGWGGMPGNNFSPFGFW